MGEGGSTGPARLSRGRAPSCWRRDLERTVVSRRLPRTIKIAARGLWKVPRRVGVAVRYNGEPALRSACLCPSIDDACVRFAINGLGWGKPRARLVPYSRCEGLYLVERYTS